MVSYYNSLPYSQKHSSNIPYPPTQSWFPSNYHPPPNHQLLSDVDSPHTQHMYYNPHMFHQAGPDWPSHENFQQSSLLQQQGVGNQLNPNTNNAENITEGLPSPPITVSGSEMSSPGAPNSASSPHVITNNNNHNRQTPVKSPYYEWMKKPSYPTQPNPGSIKICSAPSLQDFPGLELSGKTRTKDKYRVVYTDFQRLELEKEYHTSRYITIRRKTELAQTLQLSERQVKIWFQNRRAKERKQNKKRDDPLQTLSQHSSVGCVPSMMDTKPKLEPGLHLQHPLHQMSSLAMGMSSLHYPLHHPLPPPPPPPPPSSQHHQIAPGSISM